MTRRLVLAFSLCSICTLALPSASRAQEATTPPPPAMTADLQDEKPAAPAQPKPSTRAVEKEIREQKELAESKGREQREKAQAEAEVRKNLVGPNVRIELTLTDQKPGAPATSKTVVITTSNENWGRLRSEVSSAIYGTAPLNVDARPTVLLDGRVSVQLTGDMGNGWKKMWVLGAGC